MGADRSPRRRQVAAEADLLTRSARHGHSSPDAAVTALQRTAGNAAVAALLHGGAAPVLLQRVALYRGMQASSPGGGNPKVGDSSGFELGVRDDECKLEDNGDVKLASGGTSTSNTSAGVPAFTVSKSYTGGSHGTTNPATQPFRHKWTLDSARLPVDLTTRNDHASHVMLEPAVSMKLARFRELVHGTQADWAKVPPP